MGMDKGERIIRVALRLFSQYGYDSVSLREVAFDAGLSYQDLMDRFGTKEDLMGAIVGYMEESLVYECPTGEELEEALKTHSPAEILEQVSQNYHLEDDGVLRDFYRLMYVEQYGDPELSQASYRFFIRDPMEPIISTLDYLSSTGRIPPCDSRALAEMWNRTNLVLGMIACHNGVRLPSGLHKEMEQFFVGIAVRGVRPIPIGDVKMQWRTLPPIENGDHPVRRAIRDKTLEQICKYGYDKVTVPGIADELGLELSELYQWYTGKNDILRDITDRLISSFSQFTLDNPSFSAVIEEGDTAELILTLSSAYPPLKEGQVLQLYTLLFRQQFFNDDLRDLLLGSIMRDIRTMTNTLDDLIAREIIRPCESVKIASAHVYAMCSLTIGATVFPKQFEGLDELRLRIVTMLVSLMFNGYLN